MTNETKRHSTGMQMIDDALGGGIRYHDFLVLVGDNNFDLSTLALSIALDASQRGVHVAYVTMGDDAPTVHKRIIARYHDIGLSGFECGTQQERMDASAQVVERMRAVTTGNIQLVGATASPGLMSYDQVRSSLGRCKRIDVVVIDDLLSLAVAVNDDGIGARTMRAIRDIQAWTECGVIATLTGASNKNNHVINNATCLLALNCEARSITAEKARCPRNGLHTAYLDYDYQQTLVTEIAPPVAEATHPANSAGM